MTGVFSFGASAWFDLATFQATGIRSGDFTLEAAMPFSPAIVQLRSQLNVNTPNQTGLELRFPPNAETNGTITGRVFMPDRSPRLPAGVLVRISFGDLTVSTDAEGRFQNLFPIPAGPYTLTAEHPLGGLQAQTFVAVRAGGNVDVQMTLVGLGNVTITVRRRDGTVVRDARVAIERGTFPRDRAEGTTANGTIRFVNLSEGPFSVSVEELVTGLIGRASGTILRNAETAQLVVIVASGRVTGTFVAPDGRTPVANAQIVLTTRSNVRAFTQTNHAGRFELLAIPVGGFTVEGHDPLTGRLGRASGELVAEGQIADVTIVEAGRGVVEGFVLQADGATTVPGASVSLRVASFAGTQLHVTTKDDGSFRFEGVAVGAFTLEAFNAQSAARGSSAGEVAFEGQAVVQNVTLSGVATIHVRVVDADGQPAGNASVQIGGGSQLSNRQGSTDVNGEATFDLLPLGNYRVVARSLAESHNGGIAETELTEFGQTAEALVNLRGTGRVAVTVLASNGSVVPSARVSLTSQAGMFGDTFIAFTNGLGVATVEGVAVGDFFVKGESGPVAGLSTARIETPNQQVAITVQLGASGSIVGRVLLPPPADQIPAAEAIVTLNFQSQSSLQSGVLQVTTGLSGTFEFSGIPLGPFTVSIFEPVSDGVRTRTGTLTFDGEQIVLGDLVLDNVAPHVDSVTPSDKATGVALSSPIAIVFNEPMQTGSFQTVVTSPQANVFVLEGTQRIHGSLGFSSDRRTVTFTPAAPFESSTLYTVVVTGVPDGARDESNRPLLDPFTSTFTARDVVPPSIVSVSPRANERQILPEASIRVAFSEPISPALSLTLTDETTGQPVPGQLALAVANTVAIFSPTAFLKPNATYRVQAAGVVDLAGNALVSGGALPSTFFTVDTIKPVIEALQVNATRRVPGSTVRIQPTLTGSDVARVEYRIGASGAQFALASPFAIDVLLPSGVASLETTAVAFDLVGNPFGAQERVDSHRDRSCACSHAGQPVGCHVSPAGRHGHVPRLGDRRRGPEGDDLHVGGRREAEHDPEPAGRSGAVLDAADRDRADDRPLERVVRGPGRRRRYRRQQDRLGQSARLDSRRTEADPYHHQPGRRCPRAAGPNGRRGFRRRRRRARDARAHVRAGAGRVREPRHRRRREREPDIHAPDPGDPRRPAHSAHHRDRHVEQHDDGHENRPRRGRRGAGDDRAGHGRRRHAGPARIGHRARAGHRQLRRRVRGVPRGRTAGSGPDGRDFAAGGVGHR